MKFETHAPGLLHHVNDNIDTPFTVPHKKFFWHFAFCFRGRIPVRAQPKHQHVTYAESNHAAADLAKSQSIGPGRLDGIASDDWPRRPTWPVIVRSTYI